MELQLLVLSAQSGVSQPTNQVNFPFFFCSAKGIILSEGGGGNAYFSFYPHSPIDITQINTKPSIIP